MFKALRGSSLKLTFSGDKTSKSKDIQLDHYFLRAVVLASLCVTVFAGLVAWDYAHLLIQKQSSQELAAENKRLRREMSDLEVNLVSLEEQMKKVGLLTAELKDLRQPSTGQPPMGPMDEYGMSLSERVETQFSQLQLAESIFLRAWGSHSENHPLIMNTPTMAPADGWISSGFGYRFSPFTNRRTHHKGIDFAAEIGTPIKAPAHGRVSRVGYDKGYGNHITIDHGNGLSTKYAHCSKTFVQEGEKIQRGQLIGLVGNTGRSTGPHLHYEVRRDGVAINPRKYLLD